ncbi:putative glycolipid-binding domain-containing protein [Marinactinospora thermotolerans]|uniref:Glycolipid-binding n=1 Tax=Marinactinospora thermotolerans DSM 45154 TaxID=1122192 RepID=A0A1T4R3Z8_9ACTN|nr:putative glycolipid-binding domain-containing protein [Marinactinospora thermotolerans]SKA10597.1 hypothetical protein SAMN02745673_02492 [Marinactinospora thermotolerans DSM 45154]
MSVTYRLPAAWTRIDVPEGTGVGALVAEPAGFRLEGSEVIADRREHFGCRFTVRADLAWVTREVEVEVLTERGAERITLTGGGGQWTVNGRREPRLDGCLDVDVAATPLTNTLPIRRLGLEPGESRDIAVAWIDVPGLKIHRMAQRYTRLAPFGGVDRYEYRGPVEERYELTVDADGLVIDYDRFARRIR